MTTPADFILDIPNACTLGGLCTGGRPAPEHLADHGQKPKQRPDIPKVAPTSPPACVWRLFGGRLHD